MAACESLADALYALEEPWRGRFLSLVAEMATSGGWNEKRPRRDDIVSWLSTNHALFRQTERLLDAWRSPRVAVF
jgi:hypothetical protein